MARKGKDITQVIQDITNVKPRQKCFGKKWLKKKEITSRGAGGVEEKQAEEFEEEEEKGQVLEEQGAMREVLPPREDVPDGAQISKAFDTLCNIIRDRMRRVKRPEPIADFFTKGRYVLVTGDSSYLDPCFCSTTPSASHVFVTIRDGMMPYDPSWGDTPSPGPTPLTPSTPSEPGKDDGGKNGDRNGEPHPKEKEPEPIPSPPPAPKDPSPPPSPSPHHGGKSKTPEDPSNPRGPPPMPSHSSSPTHSMSYEMVEVVESVEKLSNDRKVKGYEETTTVVETMIEKTSRKKHGDRSS